MRPKADSALVDVVDSSDVASSLGANHAAENSVPALLACRYILVNAHLVSLRIDLPLAAAVLLAARF
jgi:hypothetical protein